MAEFKVDGRMRVGALRQQFKDAYGATLRVYYGRHFADDAATLASIRSDDSVRTGELLVRGNMLVGNFEEKFKEAFGIEVQVANPANTALSDNSITISAAGREGVAPKQPESKPATPEPQIVRQPDPVPVSSPQPESKSSGVLIWIILAAAALVVAYFVLA